IQCGLYLRKVMAAFVFLSSYVSTLYRTRLSEDTLKEKARYFLLFIKISLKRILAFGGSGFPKEHSSIIPMHTWIKNSTEKQLRFEIRSTANTLNNLMPGLTIWSIDRVLLLSNNTFCYTL